MEQGFDTPGKSTDPVGVAQAPYHLRSLLGRGGEVAEERVAHLRRLEHAGKIREVIAGDVTAFS